MTGAIAPRYHSSVDTTPVSDILRRRRAEAGLSQRQLALRATVPQPNIAAYESGRRAPSVSTLEKLEAALSTPSLERVLAVREPLLRAASARGLTDLRIFGSVARGTAGPGSDVDLLVHPGPAASLFDLAGFMVDAEAILGVRVDVISDRGSGSIMDQVRSEAVAL